MLNKTKKTTAADAPAPNASQPVKPQVNFKKTNSDITVTTKFVAPTDAQLSAVSRFLFEMLEK